MCQVKFRKNPLTDFLGMHKVRSKIFFILPSEKQHVVLTLVFFLFFIVIVRSVSITL